MKIGDLVQAKHDIDMASLTGRAVGKIKLGEVGILIDLRSPREENEWQIRFNSGDIWWLTEDELEILSKNP